MLAGPGRPRTVALGSSRTGGAVCHRPAPLQLPRESRGSASSRSTEAGSLLRWRVSARRGPAHPQRPDHQRDLQWQSRPERRPVPQRSRPGPQRHRDIGGKDSGEQSALAGPPNRLLAGCASSAAQPSSAAPLIATSPALCGSRRGTIETNGAGRRKCRTPDVVSRAMRNSRIRRVVITRPSCPPGWRTVPARAADGAAAIDRAAAGRSGTSRPAPQADHQPTEHHDIPHQTGAAGRPAPSSAPLAAAATGATPVSSPALPDPSAATAEYQSTNATAVTITARYPIATQLAGGDAGSPPPDPRRRADHSQRDRGDPDGMDRHPPRPESAQHRYRQQREPGLAQQGHDGPAQPDQVGPAGSDHQHTAGRDHDCRDHEPPGGSSTLEQRTEDTDQHRRAGHGDGDHRGFGMRHPANHRDVEQHQAGRGDPAEPQPFPAARPEHPDAGPSGKHDQQHRRRRVAQGLRGEQRRLDQRARNADAGTHHDHPGHPGDRRTPHLSLLTWSVDHLAMVWR